MSYSLLAPGPVNLHPEVQRILSLPMIHHRTPEFDQILNRVLAALKTVFATQQPVFMHTSTGTGGMESLLVNILNPGDKVLALVSGKFGERWAQIAQTYGANVITATVPWGQAFTAQQVADLLHQHPDCKIVLCQACETSTGVLHPIQAIAAMTRKRQNCFFLVDGITAVGALPMPMDEWGIDGLVAGSQKAFMLPTGLSFVSFSKRAWEAVQTAKTPRFYFDLRTEAAANLRGETLFSSAVPLIRALDWVLGHHQELPKLYAQIQRRAELTRFFAEKAGLALFATAPSPSLTAILMPPPVDGQKIRQQLETQFGITLMGGQDQAKGKIIRIGHMGYIQDTEMLRLFDCLGQCLEMAGANGWDSAHRKILQDQCAQWLARSAV